MLPLLHLVNMPIHSNTNLSNSNNVGTILNSHLHSMCHAAILHWINPLKSIVKIIPSEGSGSTKIITQQRQDLISSSCIETQMWGVLYKTEMFNSCLHTKWNRGMMRVTALVVEFQHSANLFHVLGSVTILPRSANNMLTGTTKWQQLPNARGQ